MTDGGYVVQGGNKHGGYWGKGETLEDAEREALKHAFGTDEEKQAGILGRYSTDDLESAQLIEDADGYRILARGLQQIS